MKKIKILLAATLFNLSTNAQQAKYNNIKEEGVFKEYLTKSGDNLKVGDTLIINKPSVTNEFTFITQGNLHAASHISNTKISITKIKSIGNKTRGYKVYVLFRGYGLLNCFIDYESAIDSKEISLNKTK